MNGNGNNKKKRKKWLIYGGIGVALVLLIAGGLIAATSGNNKIDPSKLAKVERHDLAKSVVATGKVEPITKVEIKSKASGIVKKLFVDAGDKIKKGQLLAQLDKEEIQAQVEQSRAALAASQASQKGAEADYERAKVDAEGPDVPLLKRAYDRATGMARDGVVSTSALEDAQKNYEMSLNKQNVSKAQLTVLKARIAQSQAQVARDQANLKQLDEQLSYTDIIAPIDGVLLSRDVEIGDAVSSILVLGSSATLVEVRVSINNPGGELKAAMTANAEIILEEHKDVLQIPEGAIIYDKEKKASVEVPDSKGKDGKRKVAVNIGISNGAKTEVLNGLKENDQVVLQ